MTTPGVALTVAQVETSDPMSTKSTWSDCNALACAVESRTMYWILSSLAGLPHHLSLRTTVIVLAVLSMDEILKAPPAKVGPFTQLLLKAAGVALTLAGIS